MELIYLALPDVQLSRLRVAERVSHGGHNIPQAAIERRFSRSLNNLFNAYAGIASRTQCFYNAGKTPELIFIQQGEQLNIVNHERFKQLQASSQHE